MCVPGGTCVYQGVHVCTSGYVHVCVPGGTYMCVYQGVHVCVPGVHVCVPGGRLDAGGMYIGVLGFRPNVSSLWAPPANLCTTLCDPCQSVQYSPPPPAPPPRLYNIPFIYKMEDHFGFTMMMINALTVVDRSATCNMPGFASLIRLLCCGTCHF